MPRVAALQLPFTFVATPQEFVDRVRAPMERAAHDGAELIVLPNRLSFSLLGMFAPDAPAEMSFVELASAQHLDSVRALLHSHADYLLEFYLHIFQSLAERTERWLAPGTTLELHKGELFNTALLFSPEGKIVGRQRQTHRSLEERAWGLSAGDELRVFTTDVGRIGVVIGEDLHYPEVSRILALQGANILVHPTSAELFRRNGSAGDEQHLVDLWREVQSNQIFGVQANLVSANFRGRSAVYAPVEYHGDNSGIVARAETDDRAEIISAELDFEGLQKVVDEYPIFDFFNYDLYKRFEDLGQAL